MRNIVSVVCAALVVGAWNVFGDDAVGIMEVSVPDGAPVPFAMPFEPLGDGRPSSFLSGPFVGDGDDTHSDALLHFFSGSVTGAVRTAAGWIAPGDGMPESVLHSGTWRCVCPGPRAVLRTVSLSRLRARPFGGIPCR